MSKDILHYLSPEDADKIAYWAEDLAPLIERNPRLREVDLVIEGGVGTNRTLVHMMKYVFPQALYIGMDVADSLGEGRPWLTGTIDEETLQRILQANEHPNLQMERAMVKASCVDFDLIRDIAKKAGLVTPLLSTFKAMNSLTHSRERNPFEKKQTDLEVVTFEKLAYSDNPFVAQIHVPLVGTLEAAARQSGWVTDQFDIGLLLLR